MNPLWKTYFNAVKHLDKSEATEHTLRLPLQQLLAGLIADDDSGVNVIHEPKHDSSGGGAPDFKFKKNEAIVGYLETKKIGAPLDDILCSAQLKKYQALSGNIVLTDYLQYIWLKDGNVNRRETLCYPSDVGHARAKLDPIKAAAVQSLLSDFLSTPPAELGDARKLATALATRCHGLRDFLADVLEQQQANDQGQRLYGLYNVFKRDVFHELTTAEFADAFAQTLGYGLFLAKLNAEHNTITLSNAKQYIPANFALIRELVDFLDELDQSEYQRIKWLVEEILSMMNTLDLAAIHETLSFNGSRKLPDEESQLLFAKDPYVYFYEDFLKAYDKATRKSRGVYYTPPPVVNFIVRAIDDVLRETFQIQDGLADRKRVTVLDFATGTGTFLLEVLQRVFDTVDSGVHQQIIREHILQNLYGFEYLIAPYTVAHLKLSQFLRDKGYVMQADERLRVYLTNTLEPIDPQPNFFVPALSREVQEAQEIKDQPILVITGNPPYSGHSQNTGGWVTALIDDYKTIDGAPLGERNLKWLQDDYVKFIRFAQEKMSQVDEGVVGVITNHSFLDNPTFRGMRRSLMQAFDQLYFIDLHGNAKKKEQTPDGGKDENVFDIQQGVVISLMIKKPGVEKNVYHADVWGKRKEKYTALLGADTKTMTWRTLQPSAPFYLFIPQDEALRQTYEQGWRLPDIFGTSNTGIVSKRDKIAFHFEKNTLCKVLDDFCILEEQKIKEKYEFRDSRDGKISFVKAHIQEYGVKDEYIRSCLYRPFDSRWTYYTNKSKGFLGWPVYDVMRHMLTGENLSLVSVRQVAENHFNHVFIADSITNFRVTLSNKGGAYIFPLYLYPPSDSIEHERHENITPDFRKFIDQHYGHHYPPETILGYIYAVLHSPSYRQRYREFLKRDFPRVPFTDDRQTFDTLAQLGGELLDAHLLKNIPDALNVTTPVAGDFNVAKPKYDANNQRLYVNATQYFTPVPQDVWAFHIGGYQVLDKYLKSRKNRHLSLDEIDNVKNIVKVLQFTIEQMQRILDIDNSTRQNVELP